MKSPKKGGPMQGTDAKRPLQILHIPVDLYYVLNYYILKGDFFNGQKSSFLNYMGAIWGKRSSPKRVFDGQEIKMTRTPGIASRAIHGVNPR